MVHLRGGIAALLFIGTPAYAQSLENGEPLQFGHEYHCNNERMFVSNCRDSNPSSYCMVQYPDRPRHNGFTIQKAQQLGEVLQTLNACSRTSVASASITHRAPSSKSVRAQPADADDRPTRTPQSSDGRAYLSCVINDPDWPPPLTIVIDEPRNEVRVAGHMASGTSPNPEFRPTSVVFGFAGRQFVVDRTNLSLTTNDTSFFGQSYHGSCRLSAPPKRVF